ncbi:MAG: response regulator [Myxococcota bacterium]
MDADVPESPAEVLLVEDNPSDVRLTKEAMLEGEMGNRLTVVTDGDQALAYLRREGEFAGAPRPDLILLDLNLPKCDGREVLAEIKAADTLRSIPVVVFTTSQSDDEIANAYALHANCFITKPADVGEFIGVIKQIEKFWLTTVALPG